MVLLFSATSYAQIVPNGGQQWQGITPPIFGNPSAVTGGGTVISPQLLLPDGSASAPSLAWINNTNYGLYRIGSGVIGISGNGAAIGYWTSSLFAVNVLGLDASSTDVLLNREAAGHWFQRNSTNAQRASWANTYTSSTNYEAFSVDWQTTANIGTVGTRTAATGTGRALRLVSQASSAADAYSTIAMNANGIPTFRLGLFTAALANVSSAGTGNWFQLGEFTSTATSGSVVNTAILPTYNQSSGTAANTDLLVNRTETAVGSGAQRLIDLQVGGTTRHYVTASGAAARATQEAFTQHTPPTCTAANNCGTGNGTFSTGSSDTAGRVTLGTTPASGFIITFAQAWAAAPVCMVMMDKAGMVVGKMPLTAVTTTGQITVVTNGTAPATGDIYTYRCTGLQ